MHYAVTWRKRVHVRYTLFYLHYITNVGQQITNVGQQITNVGQQITTVGRPGTLHNTSCTHAQQMV